MSTSIPLQIAETLQTAHINPHPSPEHDLNPSTAASQKIPVQITTTTTSSTTKSTSHTEPKPYPPHPPSTSEPDSDLDDDDDDDDDDETASTTSITLLRPLPRRASLPPLPDLRFEQSYLSSIAAYLPPNAVQPWKIALVTLRDQVFAPLLQGTLWTLALHGWRFWNRTARFSGRSVGARVRRWWWGVNGWVLPKEATTSSKGLEELREKVRESARIDVKDRQTAREVKDFYLQ